MLSVKDAVRGLQKELEEALGAGASLPSGAVRVALDRVMVSLPLRFTESAAGGAAATPAVHVAVAPAGQPPAAHEGTEPVGGSMTLEFRLFGAGTTMGDCLGLPLDTAGPGPLDPADADRLTSTLTAALGAPGFDSSARATVLCDALEALDESQRSVVLESLDGTPRKDIDPAVKQARHRLASVLRSGPLHSVPKGGNVLRQVLSAHPPGQVLAFIRRTWKTQEQWMEEAP
jgi:hypothetical protein